MDLHTMNDGNTVDMRDDLVRRVIVAVTLAMGPMLRDGDFCESEDIYFHVWVNGVAVEIFGGPYTFEQRRAIGRAIIAHLADDILVESGSVSVTERRLSWHFSVADNYDVNGEEEQDYYDVTVFIDADGEGSFTDKLRRIAGLIPAERHLVKRSEPRAR